MSTAVKVMVEKLMEDNGATYTNTEYDVLVRVPVQDGTGIKTGASREALEFYLKTKLGEMEFYHSWVSKSMVNVSRLLSPPLSLSQVLSCFHVYLADMVRGDGVGEGRWRISHLQAS